MSNNVNVMGNFKWYALMYVIMLGMTYTIPVNLIHIQKYDDDLMIVTVQIHYMIITVK